MSEDVRTCGNCESELEPQFQDDAGWTGAQDTQGTPVASGELFAGVFACRNCGTIWQLAADGSLRSLSE
jgi:hypothetical protein